MPHNQQQNSFRDNNIYCKFRYRIMSAEINTNTPSDDIDLLLLIERVLIFFRKYKWIFLVSSVLGLGSGILVYRYLPTIYNSSLVAHSFLLTNQEHITIIENWNELLEKKEYEELSASLNCPENIITRVKKIKAEEIQKVFSTTNPNGFVIEVNVTDNAILDELQKAIVYGLENSDYVKQRLTTRRVSLTELIEKTRTEIIKLDSTKKTIENIIRGTGKSSSSLIIDGSSINRQLLDMNEKLLSYQDELKFTAAVRIFQGFTKFKRPAGPHLIPWLIIGLLFFLTLGFLFSFISSINSKLKKRSPLPNRTTKEINT
jgi:hypothetical protein